MARYTGPKWKISRRENADVFGDDQWRRRPTLPGVHPTSKSRPSNYSIRFREKQRVKKTYGLLEKQFRNTYQHATKETGNTGLRFLQLLETRLDNIVYKLGYAKTLSQARQFVTHGHVTVNGKKLNIPSVNLNVGDTVELDKKLAATEASKLIISETKALQKPQWLEDSKVKSIPTRDMIDPSIKEQLVVEFYSR